jgi:hypothetical protein
MTAFNVGDRVVYSGNTKGLTMIRERVGYAGEVIAKANVGPRGPMHKVRWDKLDSYGEREGYSYVFNLEMQKQKIIKGDDDPDCI